jgi:superfamily II DNA helicase RecQ
MHRTVLVASGVRAVGGANDEIRNPCPLAPGTGAVDFDLTDLLRQWRRDQTHAQGVPADVVFGDRTFEVLAAFRPSTSEAMLGVPGIGPAKLEAYVDELIDLIALE